MTPEQFRIIEELFPDGFLIIKADPNGQMNYAKFNPRRIKTIELWEKWIVESVNEQGPGFWKGFITKDEIPDYPPQDWDEEHGESQT